MRRQLAERWHVAPHQVDEWPAREVALELRLQSIEADAAHFHQSRRSALAGRRRGARR